MCCNTQNIGHCRCGSSCDCGGKCSCGCNCGPSCDCDCGGECSCGAGFAGRRYYTKKERLEMLENYRDTLKKELAGVEEHIKELKK